MATYDQIEDTDTSLAAPGNNISGWTVDDIKKSDILVFRDSATEYIDTVVAPNGLQVGLLDEAFLTDLLVTGHITGSGVIYAELGFSGSLTKLVDGDDYLVAGSGITLFTQSNGSILIESTGGGGGIGGRIKKEYQQDVQLGTPLTTTGLLFANYDYDFEAIDVYLNGELMHSGSQIEVEAGIADYYLAPDTTTGNIIWSSNLTAVDLVTVTINSGGGGGTSSGGSDFTITAGEAIAWDGTTLDVLYDNNTIGLVGNELSVKKVKNPLYAGNGLNTDVFDGSVQKSFSVKPMANTPITVSSSGVGFDLTGQTQAVQLTGTDEILIWDGSSYKKTTVSNLETALNIQAGNTPNDASYLTISNHSDLTQERTIAMGQGLQSTDNGANSSYIMAVAVAQDGHLEFVQGKLAVNVGSFAGVGLIENGSTGQIDLDYNIFGTGLIVNNGVVSIDFGNTVGSVARGDNTITISAGDGLHGGGSFLLGDPNPSINIDVLSTDIQGFGLRVENNNLLINAEGTGGITVISGSGDQLIIDGSGLNGDISDLTNRVEVLEDWVDAHVDPSFDWGFGLSGSYDSIANQYSVDVEISGSGAVTVTNDNGVIVVDVPDDFITATDLAGLGLYEDNGTLNLDVSGSGGIVVSFDNNGTLIVDGSNISGSTSVVNSYDFAGVDILDINDNLTGTITANSVGDSFTLKAGNNITLNQSGNTITINGQAGGSGNGSDYTFRYVDLFDQYGNIIETVEADQLDDRLGFKAGNNVALARSGSSIIVNASYELPTINIDCCSSGSSGGGTGEITLNAGAGIDITSINTHHLVEVEYTGSQSVIDAAAIGNLNDLNITTDEILVRNDIDKIVRKYKLNDILDLLNQNTSQETILGVLRFDAIVTYPAAANTPVLIPDIDLTQVDFQREFAYTYLNGQYLDSNSHNLYEINNKLYVSIGDDVEIGDIFSIFVYEVGYPTHSASGTTIQKFEEPINYNLPANTTVFVNGLDISATSVDNEDVMVYLNGQFLTFDSYTLTRTYNQLGVAVKIPLEPNDVISISVYEEGNKNIITGFSRLERKLSGNIAAFTEILIPSLDLSQVTDLTSVPVYMNGQLYRYGTDTEITGGQEHDYTFILNGTDTYIKLNKDSEANDVISVLFAERHNNTVDQPYLTWEPTAIFDNSRQITVGDGLSISLATPREFLISNTGIKERKKHHHEALQDYIAGTATDVISFDQNIVDFSNYNFSDDNIDILIDGKMLIKDISYQMSDTDNSLQNYEIRLLSNSEALTGTMVSIVLYS